MPELKTLEDLFSKIGDGIPAENPLQKILDDGFTLTPDLKTKLENAPSTNKLTLDERKRLAKAARQLGSVHFGVVETQLPAIHALPEGEYDFVAALKMNVINETLTALYDGMEYPKEITAGIGIVFTRERLAILSDALPPGDIGPLRLTAPLQIEAFGNEDHLIFTQPFSLEFRRKVRTHLGTRDTKVSSLDGVLSFGAAVAADAQVDELLIRPVNVIAEPAERERLHVQIDSESPIQPTSNQALANFENEMDLPIRSGVMLAALSEIPTISPVIHLPIGGSIRVTEAAARTFHTSEDDVIVVGIRTTSDEMPETGDGSPSTLRNPFTGANPSLNSYVRAHQDLFRRVAKGVLASGELQAVASSIRDDLKIDDVDVDLRPNELCLHLDVRVVDACGVVFHTIDVNAHAIVTYRFSVFGGKMFITKDTNIDVSNWDIAWCILTGAIELILAGLVGEVTGVVVDAIRQIKHFAGLIPDSVGEQDNPFEIISAVFDPRVPIPVTEVLPRIEALQGLIDEDQVQSLGIASLRPDNINTYVYAKFLRRGGMFGRDKEPISGATVRLIDQDTPIPPGDDVGSPETVVIHRENPKVEITTTIAYEPPKTNQTLARGTTDNQGRVKFLLSPSDLRTSAGTQVITVTTIRDPTNPQSSQIETHTTRRAVIEALPDVFFLVTTSDGQRIDTRLIADGFVINLRSKRLGSAADPLTFITGTGDIFTPT